MHKNNKMLPKLSTADYHEISDRISLISSVINDHILQHKVCKLDKEVSNKAEVAIEVLLEAYQIIKSRNV